MCGIAGFIGKGDRRDIERMIQAVHHRGPDDTGIFVRDNVAFGHARLSIIDTSAAGHQPMANHDETVWITFNGEIYNFQQLREELERKTNYPFRSKTDTEVILAAYDAYGEKAFAKLGGMFALALYDTKTQQLFLVRDRLGKKPLYWASSPHGIMFGSELKALMAHSEFRKELDLESLNAYLSHDYIPTPKTILKNVFKLEPAQYLVWQNGTVRKEPFWSLPNREDPLSLHDAVQRLDELLEKSVRERLIADVPLGVFLSGGIDSSTVAYYAQKASQTKVKTFSIGFTEKTFDETPYARLVADHLGTEHHHETLDAQQALEMIPTIADIIDEPLADPSVIPTYLLSKFAHNQVKVAVGGDGADELFAGYPTFAAARLASWFENVPSRFLSSVVRPLLNLLPVQESNFSSEYQIKKFLDGLTGTPEQRHHRWLASFQGSDHAQILGPALKTFAAKDEFPEIAAYLHSVASMSKENQMLALYLRTYLMDEVMVKVDRASMFTSLEVRSPFLEHHLVDFVSSLPYDLKFRGLSGKYILRKLMHNRLPSNIVNRPKKGFGIPLARWLKHELKPLRQELLAPAALADDGFFNPHYVQQLQEEHDRGIRDRRKELWNLMIFQLWKKRWYN